jgi:hypothetical protein
MILEIFMRSGNKIVIDGVSEYKIKNSGDEITGLTLTQDEHATRLLLVKTIALSQIEAVVRVD